MNYRRINLTGVLYSTNMNSYTALFVYSVNFERYKHILPKNVLCFFLKTKNLPRFGRFFSLLTCSLSVDCFDSLYKLVISFFIRSKRLEVFIKVSEHFLLGERINQGIGANNGSSK